MDGIKAIEKNEDVQSFFKKDFRKDGDQELYTGDIIMKFQTKDVVPVFVEENSKMQRIVLEDELDPGENVIVEYDIMRYTKKNPAKTEYALSFKPTAVFYFPSAEKMNYIKNVE